jgi:hypothetical protein
MSPGWAVIDTNAMTITGIGVVKTVLKKRVWKLSQLTAKA